MDQMETSWPLTTCPDCGKDVSDLAPTCPNCGRPSPCPRLNPPSPSAAPKRLDAPARRPDLVGPGGHGAGRVCGPTRDTSRPPPEPGRSPRPRARTSSPPGRPGPGPQWSEVESLTAGVIQLYVQQLFDEVVRAIPPSVLRTLGSFPDPDIPGSLIVLKEFTLEDGRTVRLTVTRWNSIEGPYRVRKIQVMD